MLKTWLCPIVQQIFSATRITHVVKMDKNEIRKLQLSGFYADVDLPGDGYGDEDYSDVRETIDDIQGMLHQIAMKRLFCMKFIQILDLPGFEDTDETGEGTGLKLPYIVTFFKRTIKFYQSDGTMSKWIR